MNCVPIMLFLTSAKHIILNIAATPPPSLQDQETFIGLTAGEATVAAIIKQAGCSNKNNKNKD